MALHVHTAARADAFVRPLAELLAAPVADPLATEVVGIPTRGMERWLSQQLAQALGAAPGGRDGICANVEFRFLGGLIGQALAVRGTDPDDDPWRPDRAVWTLVDAVAELRAAAWLDHLVSHIGLDGSADPDGVRRGRRYGVLRHIADLFDRYAMHRPDMVRAWAAGSLEDGQGTPLGPDVAWQARLWQTVHRNDAGIGLFNGDSGVVVTGAGARAHVAFARGGEVVEISPYRLGAVETVYAMTIHKSQGSQFGTVAIVVPNAESRLLTRELVYTGITRARTSLIVIGDEDAIRDAIRRPIARASGLRERLWGPRQPDPLSGSVQA